MAYDTLTIEPDGPITRVWLNRPERRNALNGQALEEIAAAFTELTMHFDSPVVILGGRGASFCAGADRKDPPAARMARGSGAGPRERRHAAQLGRRALEAIERCEAITIARVHGHAVGGGLALALACDLRVATTTTVFHIPEVDLGIPLSWGAVPRLAAAVGAARAKELILLCDRFEADAADRARSPTSKGGETDPAEGRGSRARVPPVTAALPRQIPRSPRSCPRGQEITSSARAARPS